MRRTKILLGILILFALSACQGKDKNSSAPESTQKIAQNEQRGIQRAAGEKGRALAFMQALQGGDTAKMYEAANLTTEIINDSREKAVHASQYNLTPQQLKDYQMILRSSGEIDFILKKVGKIITKAALIEVTKSIDMGRMDDASVTLNTVKLVFNTKAEAPTDKTGKAVKEMTLPLLQIVRTAGGRLIYEHSFDSGEFEKLLNRNYDVKSYF